MNATIEKSGIVVMTKGGYWSCGEYEDGQKFDVKWDVKIETDGQLNEHNQLAEHGAIDRAINKLSAPFGDGDGELSLEDLTTKTITAVRKAVERENSSVTIKSITARLSPAPFKAAVSFTWNATEPVAT